VSAVSSLAPSRLYCYPILRNIGVWRFVCDASQTVYTDRLSTFHDYATVTRFISKDYMQSPLPVDNGYYFHWGRSSVSCILTVVAAGRTFRMLGSNEILSVFIAMPVFRFFSSSIRWQLLAVIIPLTVLPMLTLGLLLLSRAQEPVRVAVLQDYRSIVVQAARQIQAIIRNPQETMLAMVAVMATAPADTWQRETMLVEFQLSDPHLFKHVAFMDPNGKILVSGSLTYGAADSLFVHTYTAGLKHLLAHPSETLYQSGIYFLDDDVPALTLVAPVRRFGAQIGLLAAQLTLRELWQVVDGLRIGKTGWAYMVSPDGIVIADSDKKAIFRKDNWQHLTPVKRVLNGQTGSVDYVHPETGDIYLSAYAPLPFGWGLVVEQPAAEA